MNFKNKLAVLLLSCAALPAFVACSSTEEDPTGPTIETELTAAFSSNTFTVNPGEEISLPFTVSGVAGAVLSVTATSSSPEATVRVSTDASYQGSVDFKAPTFSDGSAVTVTLNVNDPVNKREAIATTNVTVAESAPLTIAFATEIKSISAKAGGEISLPLAFTGVTSTPTLTAEADNGWKASASITDSNNGTLTLTAPASLSNTVTVKVTAKDEKSREASLTKTISVSEISTAVGVANSFIVTPGGTITISAVKGNSTEKLTFNSADLLWQDELGLVKSVAGNGNEGVIVVSLNDGKTGNAVVTAKQNGTVVWSWHIWATDYDPSKDYFAYTSKTGTTYTFMDRNLGATSAEKYSADALGLYYQWGRKDPFVGSDGVESNTLRKTYDIDGNLVYEEARLRPEFNDHKTTSLDSAIANPDVFYYAPSSSWPVVDWFTNDAALQDNDLWGGISKTKTKYDPCPEGWKVPGGGDCWSFRSEYKKAGKLNDDSKYDPSYPWYAEYDLEYCIGFRYKDPESGKEYWFPWAGDRDVSSGKLQSVGGSNMIMTSDVKGNLCLVQQFAWGNPASENQLNRGYGGSVRCIKE